MNQNKLAIYTITIFLCLFLGTLVNSCNNHEKQTGAIAFTFDDQYVDLWYNQRDIFKKYNIKATFFISRPHLLKADQIRKLKELQNDGHEIGCHGLNHLNASEYKSKMDFFIDNEIKPAIDTLTSLGFDVVSYAYPFGSSDSQIDSVVLNYFQFLRKATWNMRDTTLDSYDEIFATSNNFRVNNAMGIDYNYKITPENFETGLIRAKEKNEAFIVYAHRINTTLRDYSVHPEYLENVFKLCNKNNIKSIRYRDLQTFLTTKN
uniref:polysaccharide deacetylase family protein n=1 Tax=uncultured Draconibacterium sp. TaxID=1573823 RepID=UPI003216B1D7